MAGTFDPKCWDLACHFLAANPTVTDDDRAQLARDLQQCAEDFCGDMECCQICSACPGFIGAECEGDCYHARAEAA